MLAAIMQKRDKSKRIQPPESSPKLASDKNQKIVHLTGTEIAGPLPPTELRKAVMAWSEQNLIGRSIPNSDTQALIDITRQGVKHGINGANEPELRLMAALAQLLQIATLDAVQHDSRGREHIKAIYRYRANAVLRGEALAVGIVVRESPDGHRYYDHFILQKKQTPAGQSGPREPLGNQPNAGVASPTGVPEATFDRQGSGD